MIEENFLDSEMNMKKLLLSILAATVAMLSQPAIAQDNFVFGGSNNPWSLDINGSIFSSVDQGWIRNDGQHITSNENYFVGNLGAPQYNNWGVFDLTNFIGIVDTAVLTLNTHRVVGTPGVYSLYDTNASLSELDAERGTGDVGGIALFSDLGSGTFYGSRAYTAADANQFRSIALNGNALANIQQSAGGFFAIGGTLSPVMAAVPEPATWAFMIFGFAAIGGAMRRQRKANLKVSYA